MTIGWMKACWETPCGSVARKSVLLVLADHTDDDGWSWPGVALMKRKTELGESTLRRIIKELEDAGLIFVQECFEPSGRQTSNGYLMLLDPRNSDLETHPHLPVPDLPSRRVLTEEEMRRKGSRNQTPPIKSKKGRVPERDRRGSQSETHYVNPHKEPTEEVLTTQRAARSRSVRSSLRLVEPENPTPEPGGAPVKGAPASAHEQTRQPTTVPSRKKKASKKSAEELVAERHARYAKCAKRDGDVAFDQACKLYMGLYGKHAGEVNVDAVAKHMNAWMRGDAVTIRVIRQMVLLFVTRPASYRGQAEIPWRSFINAREKLLVDATKLTDAAAPAAKFGTAYARAAAR